jgi:asparagine synthase (glutamine-hydrolysing)
MCGLAGIVDFQRPATAAAETLRAMRRRLRHRGPDGEGDAFGSHAALGHVRLSMLDAEGGAQPFRSADGRFLLVYDGELFNHPELRRSLPGPWRTRCDTETLLAAWAAWGEACLERLDGMFAFFIWDEERQVGFGARDRLGVKPFAYCTDGGLAFASEARAVLAARTGPLRADLDAVLECLVAPSFSGVARSAFQGVRYLPPGHVLRVDRDGVRLRRYWRWRPSLQRDAEPRALAQRLREALEGAVRGALHADVPLGVFLSGGLDSTAIAALARPALGQLPAFTAVFEGQHRWDERHSRLVISDDTPFSRQAALALGLERHEVRVDRARLPAALAALGRGNDALPAWEQELTQRALAEAAATAGMKGVLVGDAADELHYGYHFLLDAEATSGPAAILQRLGSVPVNPEVEPAPVARFDAEYRALVHQAGCSWDTPSDRVLATTQLIVERWLPRLLHNGDIHCMAFGLEARVPFCASGLLEVAVRVRPSLALRHGTEKWLLRESVRGLIPESIRTRRKSALPKDQDVHATYRAEVRRILREPHPLVSLMVDLPRLEPLLDDPAPLSEPQRAMLFRVMGLHHWAVANEVCAP